MAKERPSAAAGTPARRRRSSRRFWLGTVGGVAALATVGYLVAALVLFPAPLLPNEREVGRVLGMSEDEARRELERQELTLEVRGREPHPTWPAGTVIWQDPPPGVALPRGSGVTLTLSAGPPLVRVPDLEGLDLRLAQQLLAAAGLGMDLGDSVTVKNLPRGVAATTEPPAGDSLRIGRRVIVHPAR